MLTHEQKMAIFEEYKDPANRVDAIAKKYGIQRSKVAHIAVEMGAEPRMVKRFDKKGASHQRGKDARICTKCGKSIDVKGAKFCCFCGADIRTSKEVAAEGLEKIRGLILYLPVNVRDEAQEAILNAIKELKG